MFNCWHLCVLTAAQPDISAAYNVLAVPRGCYTARLLHLSDSIIRFPQSRPPQGILWAVPQSETWPDSSSCHRLTAPSQDAPHADRAITMAELGQYIDYACSPGFAAQRPAAFLTRLPISFWSAAASSEILAKDDSAY
jgi:hypothetical protein